MGILPRPPLYTAVKVYMLLLSACTTFVTVTFLNTTIGQPSVKLNHLILQHHVIYVNIGARSCLLCVVIQFAPVLVKGRKSGFLS